jgi:mycofactocin precursor
MRAVLLDRSHRHEQGETGGSINLNPTQFSEICHRVLNYRARPPRGEEHRVSATPEQLETATVEPEPEKDPHATSTEDDGQDLVVEDLLVEDVSIDGMCGVY